jgi:hypothetical protein
MFNKPPKKDDETRLMEAKIKLLDRLDTLDPSDPEYPKTIVYLNRLNDMTPKKEKKSVSWDTIAIVAGNLAGILVIVAYEQKHVFASKASSFLLKPK